MALIESITQRGAVPVIPPRANDSRTYDVHLYKERHLVECFINKIKQYRRISSRFDKLAARYMGFLSFVATIIWLLDSYLRKKEEIYTKIDGQPHEGCPTSAKVSTARYNEEVG